MAVQVFTGLTGPLLDNSGNVIASGTVEVYQDGTTTPISLFSDDGLSSAAANPISLDAAGTHAARYFTAENYKVVIKNSAGSTVRTIDDIDPGVGIGSGALPVANGGTAATTAAGARTNLAAAAATDMATAQSDISNHATWIGYNLTTRTRLASGTTAQRPSAGTVSWRYNSTTGYFEADNGSAWARIMRQGQALAEDFTTGKAVICVQRSRSTTFTDSTITTSTPTADSSIPQIGEGESIYTATFTPQYSTSSIRIHVHLEVENSTADVGNVLALFKDGGANAVAAVATAAEVGSNTPGPIILHYEESPGSTTPIQYELRAGVGAGTLYIGGNVSSLGGVRPSFVVIEEWLSP